MDIVTYRAAITAQNGGHLPFSKILRLPSKFYIVETRLYAKNQVPRLPRAKLGLSYILRN